jgi:hypothetical protein
MGLSLGWAEAKAAHGHSCSAAGCTDPGAINARVRNLGKGMSARRSGAFQGEFCSADAAAWGRALLKLGRGGLSLLLPLH